MTKTELLPCPFCGTDGKMNKGGFGEWFVTCSDGNCGGRKGAGIWSSTERGAEVLWNNRAATPKPVCNLFEAVHIACRDLPNGYVISLFMEKGSAWITLEVHDKEIGDFVNSTEELDVVIKQAIDLAEVREVPLHKEEIAILKHTATRAPNGLYCGDGVYVLRLCARGLMYEHGHKSCVPEPYFALTKEGKKVVAGLEEASKPESSQLLKAAKALFLDVDESDGAMTNDVIPLKRWEALREAIKKEELKT